MPLPRSITGVCIKDDEQQSKEKESRALKIQLEKTEIQETVDTLYEQKVNESSLNAQKVNHISSSTQCNIETADIGTQVQEGIIFNELIQPCVMH